MEDRRARPARAVERERSFERGQGQLVGAEGPLQRVAAKPLDQVCAAEDDPGLRPSEELVPGEGDDVSAGREALGHGGLVADVRQDARAEVVDEDDAAILGEPDEVFELRALREAHDPEIRLVHAKQDGGSVADCTLVVLEPRAVRRADLDEAGSRAREHLGNPEAVADLDELAARDHDVAPFRERGNGEEDGGGVVVDDQRAPLRR